MSEKVEAIAASLLYPGGEVRVEVKINKRPEKLENVVIGLLDNRKPNADVILDTIRNKLKENGVKDFVYYPLVSRSEREVDEEMLEKMSKVDALVMAAGDCGSCSYRLSLLAIQFEKKGIPTVIIATDVFASEVIDILHSQGLRKTPVVILKAPIEDLKKSEMREATNAIIDQVVAALTLQPKNDKGPRMVGFS